MAGQARSSSVITGPDTQMILEAVPVLLLTRRNGDEGTQPDITRLCRGGGARLGRNTPGLVRDVARVVMCAWLRACAGGR